MPSVLIGPYLLRNQPGRFRTVLTQAGFDVIDPEGDFALSPGAAPRVPAREPMRSWPAVSE